MLSNQEVMKEIVRSPDKNDEEIAQICGVQLKTVTKLREKPIRINRNPKTLSEKVRKAKKKQRNEVRQVARDAKKAEQQRRSIKIIATKTSERERRHKTGVTYFLTDEHGRVKIGHTCNLKKRIVSIQSCNADKLTFLGGTKAGEKKIHHMFNIHRIRGKWFHLVPEIIVWLEENQDGRIKTPPGFEVPDSSESHDLL